MNMNFLHVTGQKGQLVMEPYSAYNGVKGEGSNGFKTDVPYKAPTQQTMQMDNDAKAIMQNSSVLVPGEEGLADIRIVEAIYKAAKSGKRVTL
jgi:glucose-fructose oxidoreductase